MGDAASGDAVVECYETFMIETITTQLTAAGRSAVAVVGLCGPRSQEWISGCFDPANSTPWRVGQIRYGTWRPPYELAAEQNDGESVVLTPMADGHFEIHGHGGTAAVSRIMSSLVHLGATAVDAATWRRQLNRYQNKLDEPLIAEAAQVLTRCTTRSNAAIALHQHRGALLDWTRNWIDRLDEQPRLLTRLQESAAELWQHRSIGLHLTIPYRVVLAGPPNVGKSSLVNRIVGYGRSITHDEAGTTRDVVDCDTVIGGLPTRLGDTAGIRSGGGVIEREGIRRGSLAIAGADLILMVVDPQAVSESDAIEQTIRELNRSADILRVLNKADHIDPDCAISDGYHGWIQTIATPIDSSAVIGNTESGRSDGMEDLVAAIVDRLRPLQRSPEAPVPINLRQVRWIEAIALATDTASAMEHLQRLRSGAD